MKALEAALHRWSCAQAKPEDVSNCYVQFGVEFNALVHAFEGYDIPTRCAALPLPAFEMLTTRTAICTEYRRNYGLYWKSVWERIPRW